MITTKTDLIAVEEDQIVVSSGNIYADLGFPEPQMEEAKANLSREIRSIIEGRGWNHTEAANYLGIGQADVSRIVRGRLGAFSIDRLMTILTRAGQDVDITVTPKEISRPAARISVHGHSELNELPMAATSNSKAPRKDSVQFS